MRARVPTAGQRPKEAAETSTSALTGGLAVNTETVQTCLAHLLAPATQVRGEMVPYISIDI